MAEKKVSKKLTARDTNSGRKSGETLVEASFRARGIPVYGYRAWCTSDEYETLDGSFVIKDHPYETVYGTAGKLEFFLYEKGKVAYGIEVKHQSTSGSVDEKLPYVVLNALRKWESPKAILVLSGAHWDTARGKKIRNAMEELATSIKKDKLQIMNVNEFNNWISKRY